MEKSYNSFRKKEKMYHLTSKISKYIGTAGVFYYSFDFDPYGVAPFVMSLFNIASVLAESKSKKVKKQRYLYVRGKPFKKKSKLIDLLFS